MNDQERLNKIQNKDEISSVKSRRKFLAGAAAPAVLSVISKPAFATYSDRVCNISGFQSVNPSGVQRHKTSSCGGFSHGAWKTPYAGNPRNGVNGADGNFFQWQAVGSVCGVQMVPKHPSQVSSGGHTSAWAAEYESRFGSGSNAASETLFAQIFTNSGSGATLHQVLLNNSNLNFDAAAAFMSACYFGWGINGNNNIHPIDIVGLYNAVPLSSYTTVTGNVVKRPSDAELQSFFQQLQH